MMEQRGIIGEGNFFVQYIVSNYGTPDFIGIKICVTIVLLSMPFLILKDATYWMINGYLISFMVEGTLGIVLNIQAARNEQLLLSPEQAIFLFMGLVLILISIGEQIDKLTHPRIRSHIDCLLRDVAVIVISIFNILKLNNKWSYSNHVQRNSYFVYFRGCNVTDLSFLRISQNDNGQKNWLCPIFG